MDSAELRRQMNIYRKIKLRRKDGILYLRRWALTIDCIGSIKVHKMEAPDPGEDLHDHPWTFITIPLRGGYIEERTNIRDAVQESQSRIVADEIIGSLEHIRHLRPRMMRLDQCHRIVKLDSPTVWTLVFSGPRHRDWGFYTPTGYINHKDYEDDNGNSRWLEVER